MYFELKMRTELELVAYVAMNEIVWECTKDKKILFQHSKKNIMCSNIIIPRQLKSCELLICLLYKQSCYNASEMCIAGFDSNISLSS